MGGAEEKGLLEYRMWVDLHCRPLKIGMSVNISKDNEYAADWRGTFPVTGLFLGAERGLDIEITDGGSVYDGWCDADIQPASILERDNGPVVEIDVAALDAWETAHEIELIPGSMVELVDAAKFKDDFPDAYMVTGLKFDIDKEDIDVCLRADDMNFDGFTLAELRPAINKQQEVV